MKISDLNPTMPLETAQERLAAIREIVELAERGEATPQRLLIFALARVVEAEMLACDVRELAL